MTAASPPELRVLHAVRLLGLATSDQIIAHLGIAEDAAEDLIAEIADRGWAIHSEFAGTGGWSLTEDGRAENERRLAAELVIRDPNGAVAAAHHDFLPLNARLLRVVTDWQIRPSEDDEFAVNDHSDWQWDRRVLEELYSLSEAVTALEGRLTGVLTRFDGYSVRFAQALLKARAGLHEWVDRSDVDSCHRVWFQLHEDLIATLGIDRGAENRVVGELGE